jgi:hypothetical protein
MTQSLAGGLEEGDGLNDRFGGAEIRHSFCIYLRVTIQSGGLGHEDCEAECPLSLDHILDPSAIHGVGRVFTGRIGG